MFTNIFAYADDIILLAPSWAAMRQLLDLLHLYCKKLDILCNSKKTVCMMFKHRCKNKIVADEFPPFSIGSQKLMYVELLTNLNI